MRELPMLFSGAMVRAVLDGRKTQTRRVVKLPHNNPHGQWEPISIGGENGGRTAAGETLPLQGGIWHTRTGDSLMCPQGQPGDRLWVRETFAHMYRGNAVPEARPPEDVMHRADGFTPDEYVYGSWKPSTHMPRQASRITLEVTGVRVERLQDISEQDATAEGVEILRNEGEYWKHYIESTAHCDALICLGARESFRTLWDSLAAPGAHWQTNPWVWVVEFKRAA